MGVFLIYYVIVRYYIPIGIGGVIYETFLGEMRYPKSCDRSYAYVDLCARIDK